MVALVQKVQGWTFIINGALIKISALNEINCNLHALIDTSSPVLFVKPVSRETVEISKVSYKSLNNKPINLKESVKATVRFNIENTFKAKIILLILEKNWISADLVIRRDCLDSENITVIYKPILFRNLKKLHLFKEIALTNSNYETNNSESDLEKANNSESGAKNKRDLIERLQKLEINFDKQVNKNKSIKICWKQRNSKFR